MSAAFVRQHGSRFAHISGSWKLSTYTNESIQMCSAESGSIWPYLGLHGCCMEKTSDFQDLQFYPSLDTNEAIETFLKAIKSRDVLFLGDSLTLQLFKAFIMLFRSHNVEIISKDGRAISTTEFVSIPELNATIRLIEFYHLADINATNVPPAAFDNVPPRFALTTSVLRAAVRESNVVVANIGLHYNIYSNFQVKMMEYIQELMIREINQRGICFLWRSTLPQHFSTMEGTGLFEDRIPNTVSCSKLEKEWSHPSDKILADVRSTSGIPLIDMTSIFKGAFNFHSVRAGDCTHFCYSPKLFAPALTLFGEAIRQSC